MNSITAVAGSGLADAVATLQLPKELIQQRIRQIQQDLLAHSHYLRESDFTAIHPGDLEFLFDAYDPKNGSYSAKPIFVSRSLGVRGGVILPTR